MAALKPILAPEQLRKARRLAIELAGVAPEGVPTCRDVPANSHVCAAPSCNLEHCQPEPPLPDTDADLGTFFSLFGAAQVRGPDASWMPSEALQQTLFAGPCGDSATTQRPTRDATRISGACMLPQPLRDARSRMQATVPIAFAMSTLPAVAGSFTDAARCACSTRAAQPLFDVPPPCPRRFWRQRDTLRDIPLPNAASTPHRDALLARQRL